MTNLGLLARGHDRAEAPRWLGQAASLGDARALYLVGDMYSKDDRSEARRYYERAAEAGSLDAMWMLAKLSDRDQRGTGRRYLEQAAALGHAGSMRTLGTMAVRKKTYDEALRWFEQAAAAGHELAPGLVRIFSFVSGRGALRALGRESVNRVVDVANLCSWLGWQVRRLSARWLAPGSPSR
jgi:TPR repeat protein